MTKKLYVILGGKKVSQSPWDEKGLYESFSHIVDSMDEADKFISSKLIKVDGLYVIDAKELNYKGKENA